MGIIFENTGVILPGLRDRRTLPPVSFQPTAPDELITLSNTAPVVWNWGISRTAKLILTADRTIDIAGAVNGARATLLFNPKGFNLTLPATSKAKVGYFNGILWGDFSLPTQDNLFELGVIYDGGIYYWTLSSYDFNL